MNAHDFLHVRVDFSSMGWQTEILPDLYVKRSCCPDVHMLSPYDV